MGLDPLSLPRGATIGGWEIQRRVGDRPWPEAKAERADGTLGRLMVVPTDQAPAPATLAAWRSALAPLWLDHPAFPVLRGVGHDPAAGGVWIARAWTPWTTFAAIVDGTTRLPVGRRGAALLALGEALSVLHRSGAIHGALTPSRILLSRADGSACEVLDLGLATVAAGLGLRVPGAQRPPEDEPSAAGDVRGFAAIVDAMLVNGGPARGPWHGPVAAWCEAITAAPPSARPTIDEAVAALRELLPPPEPPEPPPPPILPPSARELEIIERNERKREAEEAAQREAQRRDQQPATLPPPVGDRNPPFLRPIVKGGPGIGRDAWPALVRGHRPDAVFDYDPEPGTLTTGPVTWRLGYGQLPDAAAAIALAIGLALDALARSRAKGALDAELRAAGFEEVDAWPGTGDETHPPASRPRTARWWHQPGLRVEVDGGVLTLQRECQAWVTSHDLGTVGDTVAELTMAKLPRAKAARTQLLGALLTVAARIDDRPTVSYLCRFCRQGFGGLHFNTELGACHGCSERHLHIVY